MRHLRYVRVLLRHKWHVLLAGVVVGVPLGRLIKHDLSKFRPSEWGPYSRVLAGGPRGAAWERAKELHHERNDHHWEHHMAPVVAGYDARRLRPELMSEDATREMLADWVAAGRTYRGSWDDVFRWYDENRDRVQLHPATRQRVVVLLEWFRRRTQRS